ncbi:MAG: hypothetical protein Q8829_02765 [Candidatus Phytoplasma australasiaticum]|nr:hypothetical protein [Candidatus Phytoplasma australasiaticum]
MHAASKTPTKGKKGMVQTDEDGSRKRKQGMQKSREPNGMISVSCPTLNRIARQVPAFAILYFAKVVNFSPVLKNIFSGSFEIREVHLLEILEACVADYYEKHRITRI